MNSFWLQTDDVLRGARGLQSQDVAAAVKRVALQVGVFGAIYGAVMGTFAVSFERSPHIVFAACKVPLLLLVTGALSLPLFAVLYTLCGLRDELGAVLRALLYTQSALAVILASLSPLVLVCYASVPVAAEGYRMAVLCNAFLFGIAALVAQRVLKYHLAPLLQREPRHRPLLRAWLVIYGFIGIQMAWVLRPFIGDPNGGIMLFRGEWGGNAYVVLTGLMTKVLGW